jgi:hypothetical protein
MSNDIRALCAELVKELHKHTSLYDGHESAMVTRARAALAAEPEPVGATDEDLWSLWVNRPHLTNTTPAALRACYDLGRQHGAAQPQATQPAAAPVVVPVPVSERLPGEGDCDAEGKCWLYSAITEIWHYWRLPKQSLWTHWLPYHAIPLPQAGEGQE